MAATTVSQVESEARWAEMSVMSGDVGFPFCGSRVGLSVLSSMRSLSLIASAIVLPRCRAQSQDVVEYHAGWWAFRSPQRMVSPSLWEKMLLSVKAFKEYPGRQLLTGGR